MTKDGPSTTPSGNPGRPAFFITDSQNRPFSSGRGDINDKLLLTMKTHSKLEHKQPIFTLDPLNLKSQCKREQFREVEGLNFPSPYHFKGRSTQKSGREEQRLERAPPCGPAQTAL